MSEARLLIGDVFDRMAELPDASVDLILTSPPFLALRSYLPADHPDKAKEIGSEPTPAAFLDTLLRLTAEWRRLLAPHGSICVELGDTYSGSGGAGGDYAEGGLREDQPKFRQGTPRWDGRPDGQVRTTTSDPVAYPARARDGWPLAKSLCGIPHLYHLSLAYGRNVLRAPLSARQMLAEAQTYVEMMTGADVPMSAADLLAWIDGAVGAHEEVGPTIEIEPWRVRNVVAWCRPNPPVGALGDKFRPGTSYMTVACVSGQRYFDLDAVRVPGSANTHARTARGVESRPSTGKTADDELRGGNFSTLDTLHSTDGAPPLDWWEIPTHGYPGSHYATWPPALCERPIKAMCPQRVCVTCGEPSRRIVDSVRGADPSRPEPYSVAMQAQGQRNGWTDCGHDNWRTGTVLDPFAGSGTTLAVATGHGRNAIGIDLDDRNAALVEERVGRMFLTIEAARAALRGDTLA